MVARSDFGLRDVRIARSGSEQSQLFKIDISLANKASHTIPTHSI